LIRLKGSNDLTYTVMFKVLTIIGNYAVKSNHFIS